MKEIEPIKILHPDVMKAGADKTIRKKLYLLAALEDENANLFMQQTRNETKINELRTELDALKGLYEVKYKESKPKEFVKGEAPTIVESNGTIHIGE